ncbi:MAG: hypothetical protein IPH76_15320 [Xanthomonadales bacterium]|nr:hypothetical protein [Xanthomonadales bacterium]
MHHPFLRVLFANALAASALAIAPRRWHTPGNPPRWSRVASTIVPG